MGDIIARGLADKIMKTKPRHWLSLWDYLEGNAQVKRLLFIGDSLTTDNSGYYPLEMIDIIHNRLGLSDFQHDRYAYAGYRWGDIPFETGILPNTPNAKVITIMLGTNDAKLGGAGASIWATKYYANRAIHEILNWLSDAEIRLLLTPWVRDDTTDGFYQPIGDYRVRQTSVNTLIRSLSRRFCEMDALDTYSLTEGQNGWYQSDGLHFNQLGGRHVAVALLDHLRKRKDFIADRFFLVGKPYTLSGGTISGAYPETDRKITSCNSFSDAFEITNQIGYMQDDNGGSGSTLDVTLQFDFGEQHVINDITMRFGNLFAGYAPNSIGVQRTTDGTTWDTLDTINSTSEESVDEPLAGYTLCPAFVYYAPNNPFYAKGVKLTFSKTFAAGRDWFFIGQMEMTKLNGYNGTIT